MTLKPLILAAALIATAAHATDIAYAPNQADGAIVLTDVPGNCPKGSSEYYTTDAGGAVMPTGCWYYSEPWVKARGYDGVAHQYRGDQFTLTEYATSHLASKHTKSSM